MFSITPFEDIKQKTEYVAVKADGYTVANSLVQDTVISSFVRTGVGLWSATLKQGYGCNLNWFDIVPVLYTSSSPAAMLFTQLGDNVGVAGTTNSVGAVPQIIKFMFSNASSPGTAADLPANAGFRYEIGLQVSSAYYKKSY